jgi:hypothetical protein
MRSEKQKSIPSRLSLSLCNSLLLDVIRMAISENASPRFIQCFHRADKKWRQQTENASALGFIQWNVVENRLEDLNHTIPVIGNITTFPGEIYSFAIPSIEIPSLRSLTIKGFFVRDLWFIEHLANLESLTLNNIHARRFNIASLSKLKSLKKLRLFNVVQLSELTKPLPSLSSLEICDSPEIVDISIVLFLPNLTSLSLNNCWDLQDMSPIASLRRLEKLSLRACHRLEALPKELPSTITHIDLIRCSNLAYIASIQNPQLPNLQVLYVA